MVSVFVVVVVPCVYVGSTDDDLANFAFFVCVCFSINSVCNQRAQLVQTHLEVRQQGDAYELHTWTFLVSYNLFYFSFFSQCRQTMG